MPVPLPELILDNARIRTMDPDMPWAASVAVRGRTVLDVSPEVRSPLSGGPHTRRIDLGGRLVLPGFWDSHFHYYQWAMGRRGVPLNMAQSLDHCLFLLRAQNQTETPDGWIQGQGFNESDWPENRLPLRQDLDQACPDRPVLIWRCDLHLAVANSRALELACVGPDTAKNSNGLIELDPRGELTGVLREEAVNCVKSSIPEPSFVRVLQVMHEAQAGLHALGLTGIHDVRLAGNISESALTFRAWQALRQERSLLLRCWTSLPGENRAAAAEIGLRTGLGDEYLRLGHLKYFMDGGMGARTAWMLEPYLDTKTTGLCVLSPDEMLREAQAAEEAGLSVMVHAIGDRTNRELITLFQKLQEQRLPDAPPLALEHRIEHVQVIRQEDIRRLAGLNMPVTAQPPNMILDINMIDQCAGAVGRHAYAFRSILDAGVPLLFSSDCPVCDPTPLAGIQAAVTRARMDGTPWGGWHPEQKISLDEALAAYTISPARAYGLGHLHGSVTPGKFADMIVLDQDIFNVDPSSIADTQVSMTVFDGRIVHQA
ncbi:MAG TPA: amidohydrolase [Desulfonatronum sp.]|nr:amidohydrolase [Desulfonatronum sp.]